MGTDKVRRTRVVPYSNLTESAETLYGFDRPGAVYRVVPGPKPGESSQRFDVEGR